MCCVQLSHVDRLLRFSIENVSKRLDYPAVVCRGAIPAFCRCCNPTGRWFATLKAEKHGLIEKPLPGAIFQLVVQTRYVCRVLEESCMHFVCVGLA